MREQLGHVLDVVAVEPWDSTAHADWAAALVDADDVHVLAAAKAAGADVLLTGDTTHFQPLMSRDDLGVRVRKPRALLREGPVPGDAG